MTRQRSGSGRVSSGRTTPSSKGVPEPKIPSYRSRHPFMFAMIVLAVGAMVLGTVASFLSLLI